MNEKGNTNRMNFSFIVLMQHWGFCKDCLRIQSA